MTKRERYLAFQTFFDVGARDASGDSQAARLLLMRLGDKDSRRIWILPKHSHARSIRHLAVLSSWKIYVPLTASPTGKRCKHPYETSQTGTLCEMTDLTDYNSADCSKKESNPVTQSGRLSAYLGSQDTCPIRWRQRSAFAWMRRGVWAGGGSEGATCSAGATRVGRRPQT